MYENVIIGGSLSALATAKTLTNLGQKYIIIECQEDSKLVKSYSAHVNEAYGIPIAEELGDGGGSKVWHGVIAMPTEDELSKICNLRISRESFQIAAELLNVNLTDFKQLIRDDDTLLNTYLTPSKPFCTKEWLANQDVIKGFVHSIERTQNIIQINLLGGSTVRTKKLFLCTGALQTFGILARSSLIDEKIIFPDHIGFPIGVINAQSKNWFSSTFPVKAKNYWTKIAYQYKINEFLSVALFLRPTISAELNVKTERARQTIVAIRSGKVKIRSLIHGLASVDSLLKLIYLKWKKSVNVKLLEVYAVCTQNPKEENNVCKLLHGAPHVNWSPNLRVLKANIENIMQHIFNKSDLKFKPYEIDKIIKVATGSAHISGTALGALSDNGVELSVIPNAYICGASAFANPIVENNTFTSMALSAEIVKFSLGLNFNKV